MTSAGEPVGPGPPAHAGLLQRVDGAQEGPRQGQGPGPLQAHAEAPVPAREGAALLQEEGGERRGLREGAVLQLQALPECELKVKVQRRQRGVSCAPNKQTFSLVQMSAVGITENAKGDNKKFEIWCNSREEVFIVQVAPLL